MTDEQARELARLEKRKAELVATIKSGAGANQFKLEAKLAQMKPRILELRRIQAETVAERSHDEAVRVLQECREMIKAERRQSAALRQHVTRLQSEVDHLRTAVRRLSCEGAA